MMTHYTMGGGGGNLFCSMVSISGGDFSGSPLNKNTAGAGLGGRALHSRNMLRDSPAVYCLWHGAKAY